MDKFLLVLFFVIKILAIVVAPIVLYIFRNRNISKAYYYLEIVVLLAIIVLYVIGFSYVVDSSFSNMLNLKLLDESKESNSIDMDTIINISNYMEGIEADNSYRDHKNNPVYYYNGFEYPLSTMKVQCNNGYDFFKYYSDIITSTSMLLSTYFDEEIDPVEVYKKTYESGLIKCGERIDKDKFFSMIYNEYKVNFVVAPVSQLENYLLGGNVVLLETNGNGNLSCNESYFLVYDINNFGDYLLLDPNNKSYNYICPDGSTGFGSILKANYNEQTFSSSSIISDGNRLILIGGTR